MEISIAYQLQCLLWSVLFGIGLVFAYDLYSTIPLTFGINLRQSSVNSKEKLKKIKAFGCVKLRKSKALTMVFDIIFFILILPITLIFLHGINFGILRVYILLGLFIGAIVYRATFGKVLSFVTDFIGIYLYVISYYVFLKLIRKTKGLFLKIFNTKNKRKNINKNSKTNVFSIGKIKNAN